MVGIKGAMPLCFRPASADGLFRSAAAVGVDEGGRGGGVEGIEAQRLSPCGEDDGRAEAGCGGDDDAAPLCAVEARPRVKRLPDGVS